MSSINPSPNHGRSDSDAHLPGVASDAVACNADLGVLHAVLADEVSTAAHAVGAPSGPEPGSERLFVRGNRMAVAIYRFFESRSRADLRYVFDAACGALAKSRDERSVPGTTDTDSQLGTDSQHGSDSQRRAAGTQATRVALARDSLEEAARSLDRVPSRREYDRWRDQQPRPDEFATSSFIRRAFDHSWVKAAAEVGGLSPDPTARRLLQGGKAFTSEELERALAIFVAAVPAGRRTQDAYRRWANAYVGVPGAFDVPLRPLTLTGRFGMVWTDLMGSVTGEQETVERAAPNLPSAPRGRSLTREEKLDCLRRCASELKVDSPTIDEFNRWVVGALDDSGRRLSPRATSIAKPFGSWARALFAAGLLSEEGLALHTRGPGLRADADKLLSFLAAALRDRGTEASGTGVSGTQLSHAEFKKWRVAVMLHPECRGLRIPSDQTILERLGGDWKEVIRRARGAEPSPAVPAHWHAHQLQRAMGTLPLLRVVEG